MHRILVLVLATSLFLANNLKAQELWTLERCIEYAMENNIQIKQMQLNATMSENNYKQAKAAALPSLNAGGNYNFNFGTAVDPFTYQFVENNVQSMNIGLSSSISLFQGFRIYNTMEQRKYDFQAGLQSVEKIKNSIAMNLALAYLNILFAEELVGNAQNQFETTKLQVLRTEKLVNAGSLAKGSLLEMQAQAAGEELRYINAQNQLRSAQLNLVQMLDLDSVKAIEIQRPQFGDIEEAVLPYTVEQVFAEAQQLPEIKEAQLNLKSAEKGLQVSRSYNSPTLSLNASYGTGYSNARVKYIFDEGSPKPREEEYPFADQMTDNTSTSLAFGLNIPIFNKLQVKTGISNSIINVENSRLQLQSTKNQLYKEIQQAHSDALAALSNFSATQKALSAMRESFKYTQQKFDVGMVNSVDYNTSKNQLTQAESDLLQAKYDYIFKRSVLQFYTGQQISLQ